MADKKKATVSVFESRATEGQANVYDAGALVATLRREGSGWIVAWFRAGYDGSGLSRWLRGGDREPRALTHAADAAIRLVADAGKAVA